MNMNQFINTILFVSLTLGACSALAEDKTNTKDSMDALTQNQTTEQPAGSMAKKGHMRMSHKNRMSSKMMDTNGDGMISKEEFMAYHEDMYSKMKQTNGGVSIKDMDAEMHIGTTKGNKLQPSDTKNTPPAPK